MGNLTGTPEQIAIADAVARGGNLFIRAFAGCGKTTTLVNFVAPALPRNTPALAVAFNKKIKDELEKRLPPSVNVKTLNGLGHSAWGQAIRRRLTLDEKKLGRLITATAKEYDINLSQEAWADVRGLVSRAMQLGVIPAKFPQKSLLPDTEETWEEIANDIYADGSPILYNLSRKVLTQSIMEGYQGIISFDDQIYLSALFGGIFPRYPVVIVDEAQDLSPLNLVQIQKSAADRLIVAGDELQSIYAFRGADHESMAKLRALRKEWTELPLTLTFRCPHSAVARQQDHAPGFRAHSANAEGKVLKLPLMPDAPTEGLPTWSWQDIQEVSSGEIAILCRNNGPLLQMAFKLIRRGIAPVMLGREIGKGLVKLSQKIFPDDEMDIRACRIAICEWRDSESSLALANGKEEKLAGIHDRAECLLAVLSVTPSPRNARELRAALTALFARDSGKVTLASIHKAKGLEWGTVVFLDPWRVPSKYAKAQATNGDFRQLLHERNLVYVAETRTKDVLILASLEDFE